MDSGRPSSLDEISITASALRRFARTPTGHRLGLRRSTTESTSSSSTSSFEPDQPPPCVYETTRGTLSDECALHRFIVWAAVKRNACPKMTSEERRECPLFGCRERFPDHEGLLQHLYDCKYLEHGKYWCYDCGRVETFHDINKCRRSHPSKRKRLISVAKSFLSSLGRPKTPTPSLLDLEVEDNPYSYVYPVEDECSIGAHPGFELQSNEIHEIASSEVTLPTIPEDRQQDHLSRSSSAPSTYTAHTQPLSIHSRKSMAESSYRAYLNRSWSPHVETVSPADLVKPDSVNAAAKPALQLNTRAAFDISQAQSRRRTSHLQPTSSVRSTSSTTSTNSTNSTNSTSSTASYTISPTSVWSGSWGIGTCIESNLTSPADDVPNSDDVLPCSHPLPPHPHADDVNMAFSKFADESTGSMGLTELSADVPTVLHLMDAKQSTASTVDPPVLSSTEILQPESFRSESQQPQQLIDDLKRRNKGQASPHELVHSARDTWDLHVSDSQAKLRQLRRPGENHVASNFCGMTANFVAFTGLKTMSDMLRGKQPQSPSDVLCFLHIAYSLCFVIHGQDATRWSTEFFNQAAIYCSWMTLENRFAYWQVLDFLWTPGDMTGEDFTSIQQRCLSRPSSTANARNNKEPAYHNSVSDPLLFISQYFLDELEYAALQNTTRPEIQTSSLCVQHLETDKLATIPNSPFVNAARNLILSSAQQYHNAGGFFSSMEELLDRLESNHISTVRQLELELLHLGKTQLPPDLCDVYVQHVWEHIESLRIQDGLRLPCRRRYNELAIELVVFIMHASDSRALDSSKVEAQPETPDHCMSGLHVPTSFAFNDLVSLQPCFPSSEASLGSIYDTEQTAVNQQQPLSAPTTPSTIMSAPSQPPTSGDTTLPYKENSDMCCEICGYRPRGNPQWFRGSMAKHKKLMHAKTPPKIYPCPFPGCKSQYKNRYDNLQQHQNEKGHFVAGQESSAKSRKRRRLE
ncbi:uncharacterized protein MAM_06102 [Metarhizium album ARSEF 1941]|uniref:Zinc finger, C2H2-type/integrase, DNA-binding protein n=1 Tax=Metarhizium album (strain ARSEF 1941) TaxID=1081103 RepID=A0A0B2WR74_METAS|nr:uncharacterized protein MAM_06102 [Metarhizium album ARSEF 1941]KHN95997.1 hypothetical protein MAM_06102 [Metarhizium album ARSEF 1941]